MFLFRVFKDKNELNEVVVWKELYFFFVWKSCMGGYDGKGVFVICDVEDIILFLNGFCIVEKFIFFKNELVVIVVWNFLGEVIVYFVVEMEFYFEVN